MVRPLELDNEANVLFEGLKVHAAVRVEHLTLSVPRGSGIDLEKSFQSLIVRIVGKNNKSKIQYAGVLVDNPPEHAHILWVKPYVRWNRLNAIWADIIKAHPMIVSKTVKGDKSKRNDVRRLVYYLVEDQSHHCVPLRFFHSSKWLKKPKLTKKLVEKQLKEQESLSEVLTYD
ncbi:MAG: hypothetical protein ABSG49_10575 [Methanoregula sp.]|jgi:hypothetical protein|uniref:hypothetical protein n=1 Tax=Methanoregula sp. TaxID=2052170 RepID=UPI003C21607E